MDKMVFDLYLDESGKFTTPGEHTLIGGVIIPHEKNPSLKEMQSWETDIRSRISESNCFTPEDLAAGDEWHRILLKIRRLKHMDADLDTQYQRLDNTKRYVFNHCSENRHADGRSISGRWEVQGWILKEYIKKLKACDGFPVIFDNPNGIYHIDSNTTFMAVFASGVVKLYNELMIKYSGKEIVLIIHAASRLNITKKQEADKYAVSPTAGKEANLERSLYINHIKNFVFLNGGSDLLDLSGFQESISSFDILQDFNIKGENIPNPATVICDYVCNCALSDTERRGYGAILAAATARTYIVFGKNPDLSKASIQLLIQNHDWFALLKALISRSFPEEDTIEFFVQLNQDHRYNQMNCVNSLVSYLFPFISNREDMETWEERLKLIIEKCAAFESSAYLALKANILVYIHSLQTHMGKDVHDTISEFNSCISQIKPMEQRDALLILFSNRQIVTETDCFCFDRAEDWFETIETYSENALKNSRELMSWFAMLSDGEITDVKSEQYGRALGSYVQLLTKEIRSLSGEKRTIKKESALRAAELAFKHLSTSRDISRAYQNACDLFVELGEYDNAMKHLYMSVSRVEENVFSKQCEFLLYSSGHYGEKPSGIFPYLHYVSMMHRCFRMDDPHGEEMLDAILKESINIRKIEHLISEPHPHAVVLWHLAASLAHHKGREKIAEELFNYSIKALTDRGELFWTIKMAIQAEMIALGLEGKMPGNNTIWKKRSEEFFTQMYPIYSGKVTHNPFTNIHANDFPTLLETLYQFADKIVY